MPLINHDFARSKFDTMKQEENETVGQYYVRLRQQGLKCNLHDIDDTIRTKLLHTIKDGKLR